jgi:U32 family peptidase
MAIPELISPAGGIAEAYAAFHFGADAVYLGLENLSARADARNFTPDQLGEIASFAHSLAPRRRVFVAINTLLQDRDLGELVDALAVCSDACADAVVMQDIGAVAVARKYFPELPVHASTQMAVHDAAGARALARLGVKRVILARELALDEIREIARASGVETEVFIHGALCYSYSGLCLLSSHALGRSGNRGRCAYLCRARFNITAPSSLTSMPFAMKDLALPEHVRSLADAGVAGFKIEGRKKSPLYVAAVTNFYRRLMDGSVSEPDRAGMAADIQSIFSRPWTPLFIRSPKDQGAIDPEMGGHRGAFLGNVDGVARIRGAGAAVRFTPARPIEVRDGLQIEIPGVPRPFGFSVARLRVDGREAFTADAGHEVEALLPEHYPEIPVGAPVFHSSSQAVKQKYGYGRPKPGAHKTRRRCDFAVSLAADAIAVRADVPPRFPGDAQASVVKTFPAALLPAKSAGKMQATARRAFERLGDTRLELGDFALDDPQSLFAAVSLLSPIRQDMAAAVEAALDAARAARVDSVKKDVCVLEQPIPASKRPALAWSVKTDRIAHLSRFEGEDWEGVEEAIIDVSRDAWPELCAGVDALAGVIGQERIRLALPAITRPWEEKELRRRIAHFRKAGHARWEAASLSAFDLLSEGPPIDLAADWTLYVLNRAAIRQWLALGLRRVTLSPEDDMENMRSLLAEFGERAAVVVYQDTPLMVSESCAFAGLTGGCTGKDKCGFGTMEMVSNDRSLRSLRLLALNEGCRTVVINQSPFSLAHWLGELAAAGAARVRADFIHRPYSPEQARDTWRMVRSGRSPSECHEGNYVRGLLLWRDFVSRSAAEEQG